MLPFMHRQTYARALIFLDFSACKTQNLYQVGYSLSYDVVQISWAARDCMKHHFNQQVYCSAARSCRGTRIVLFMLIQYNNINSYLLIFQGNPK